MKFPLSLFIVLVMAMQSGHAQSTASTFNVDSLKKAGAANKEANRVRMAKASIQHFVIKADSNTYGYSIYLDGNLYIQQLTVPAMPGRRGFATVNQAEKAALLAIAKIKQGELPPTLTVEELRKHKLIQ